MHADIKALEDLLKGGDDAAFEELYLLVKPEVQRYVRGFLGPRFSQDVDDVMSAAFLNAWQARRDFGKGPASFAGWVGRIARNWFISQQRRPVAKRQVLVDEVPDRVMTPEYQIEDAWVWDLLNQLPETYRACYILTEAYKLGEAEVAELLGVQRGTVKSRLFRARRLVKQLAVAC